MKGSLNIVGTIATVVGGSYGAVAVALCGILGSVLSLGTQPNEPDLAMMFIEKVRDEPRKFNHKLQNEKFHGLDGRVKNMNSNLKILLSTTKDVALQDRVLFETDLPRFFGEVSQNVEKGLSHESKEEDIDDCLRSMVVYCNAQMSLPLLLANVLSTFQVTVCFLVCCS